VSLEEEERHRLAGHHVTIEADIGEREPQEWNTKVCLSETRRSKEGSSQRFWRANDWISDL
jgi:hypothetical protein